MKIFNEYGDFSRFLNFFEAFEEYTNKHFQIFFEIMKNMKIFREN
jgi:hypothetical protein